MRRNPKTIIFYSISITILLSVLLNFEPYAYANELEQMLPSNYFADAITNNESNDEFNGHVAVPDNNIIDSNTETKNNFWKDSAILYGGLWAGRFFYVRNKNARIFDTSFSDWIDNITQWPETDDGDDFVTNFITHPYIGSLYYLFYRERGHSVLTSALGSLLQSTLFEYTIEGTVETPSLPDLIFTPGLGAPLGFVMYESSEWLLNRQNKAAKTLAYLIDPMKLIIKDQKFGIVNPLSGTFGFHGTFEPDGKKNPAYKLAYSNFLESPVPIGRVMANTEVVNLKKSYGGEFIMYYLRADLPADNNRYGLYVRISQAGVNSVEIDGDEVRDGFEFANAMIGGKTVALCNSNSVLSMGMDLILPTAYKDNIDRLQTVVNFQRDFPYYLQSAWTFSPYLATAIWNDYFILEGNFGSDLIVNADKFEGNSTEARFKYYTSIAATLPFVLNPTLYTDLLGIYIPTADDIKQNDILISPGIRIGEKYVAGFAVQVPLTGPSEEVAKISFIIDLQARF